MIAHNKMMVQRGYITGFFVVNSKMEECFHRIIEEILLYNENLVSNTRDRYEFLREKVGVITNKNIMDLHMYLDDIVKQAQIIYKEWNQEKFFSILENYGVSIEKKIGQLSKIERQLVQLSFAKAHGADIFVCVEDEAKQDDFKKILFDELTEDNAIYFLTNNMDNIDNQIDYFVIVDNGDVVFWGNEKELMEEKINSYRLEC